MIAAAWPDTEQTLLLKAALSDGSAALEAFARWRGLIDLSAPMDAGSFRLLPLAYVNLTRLGCADPEMARLKGIYRHSWCAAQSHLHVARSLVDQCAAMNVTVMTLKGLALAHAYYDSPALRPMSDIDVMVPADRADQVIAALKEDGWQLTEPHLHSMSEFVRRRSHALSLRDPKGNEVDLHWRPLAELVARGAAEAMWLTAVPISLGGSVAQRPDAEQLLLQVCVHGTRPNLLPPIRWIADAVTIIRKTGAALEWSRLVEFAGQERVQHRLGLALDYLAREFEVEIPEATLRELGRYQPAWFERIEARQGRLASSQAKAAELGRWLSSDLAGEVPLLAFEYFTGRMRRWVGA